ncbi:MAG: hypothetical protein E7626_05650 [Ruminococcaceae bacterium]|nr:hypothetical protein [Oscillospiraceae bacterium]
MKKTLALLIALLSVFSSCQRKLPSAADLIFEVLGALDDVPAYAIYYSDAPKYSGSTLSPEDAELLYRDCDMCSYAESFAVALGKDDSVWEIHVFIALSAGDAGFIEDALTRRLEMLRDDDIYVYDAETYESRIESAKVVREGRLVCLTVCGDNALAAKKILGK